MNASGDLLESLNEQQRAAVLTTSPATLITAGPGTGKTKTLTARIVHLLTTQQVPASQLVALTFTNKAAAEMRQRVAAQLPTSTPLPCIATFHALAQQVLPDEREIVSETERLELLVGLRKHLNLKQSVRDLSLELSRAKNRLEQPKEQALAQLLEAYNLELSARKLQDFDDLLLRLHAWLLEGHDPGFRTVLVDEFQDTNELQFAILQQLTAQGSVFAIGDPLQAIYGFRGASADIFGRFTQAWPEYLPVVLHANYRSVPAVVRCANAIFPEAPQLEAQRQAEAGQPAVRMITVLNEFTEADWVVQEIERLVGGSSMLSGSAHHGELQQQPFRNIAVLYRTHAVARQLRMALEGAGLPYQVAGEGTPYEQPAIAAILAVLREQGEDREDTIQVRATAVARQLGLLPADKPDRQVQQFLNGLALWKDHSVKEYFAHLEKIAEQQYYDPTAEAVTLLTIHAAKGLEFGQVMLLGAEEGILPYARPDRQKKKVVQNLAEEKRLFYVAVTRARDNLTLLQAQKRNKTSTSISRFVTELPAGVLDRQLDPAMAAQKQRLAKAAHKRAQGSLF